MCSISGIRYVSHLIVEVVPRNTKAPHLKCYTDKRILAKDFIVEVIIGSTKHTVIVPKNFVTDGSSIPRVFHWWKHPMTTEAFYAAVVHDYLYATPCPKYNKRCADKLFERMIQKDGGGWFMRKVFYCAVRLNVFGGNF